MICTVKGLNPVQKNEECTRTPQRPVRMSVSVCYSTQGMTVCYTTVPQISRPIKLSVLFIYLEQNILILHGLQGAFEEFLNGMTHKKAMFQNTKKKKNTFLQITYSECVVLITHYIVFQEQIRTDCNI